MEKGLVAKALFMIAVIIVSIFTISNFNVVKAEENNLCCEKTTGGDSCVYTTADSCDTNYLTAATSCEQTSFCKPGCCVSDVGKCSKGVGQATCEDLEGYSWYEGAACEIDACQEECCVVGEAQCFLSTEAYCKNTISSFEDLELDWRDVSSESECVNICEASTKGCCVSEDSCTYDTKSMCDYDGVDLVEGVGFYEETYCSNVGICGCVNNEDDIRCVNEDAYYFDSCGNQDELYDDCDYAKGTWCGTDDNGNVGCLSTGCEDTFDGIYSVTEENVNRNTHDSKIGKERKNGESWCLYESPAGGWFDRPGSQHYRSICYFGEEIIEPCADYREEVCIQYPYTSSSSLNIMGLSDYWYNAGLIPLYDSGVSYNSGYPVAGSACIDNGVYQNLINANVTTVPRGQSLEKSSDVCFSGSLSCPVTYAKDSRFGEWKCVYNCNCLTKEWADQAAGYCATFGDCGAKYNLLEESNFDGFYITASQYAVGDKENNETLVGMDEGCASEFAVEGDNEDCVEECKKEDGNCDFIDGESENYDSFMKSNYGVYGGMVGFSESIATFSEGEWVASKLGTIGFVTASVVFAAAVITTAVIEGVTVSAAMTALLTLAAGSATVPVAGWIIAGVALLIAGATFLFASGGESMTVTVTSNCNAWQPPQGGEYCTLCDIPVSEKGLAIDDGKGNILNGYECTEYKCKSLGALCEYITENQGSDRPKCIASEINDADHPLIKSAYLLGDYADLDVDFSPDYFLIVNEKVQPYTFFEFAIETDEASQCKIEVLTQENSLMTDSYDAMTIFFPDSYFGYVHNQSWILMPDTKYQFNIRCIDINERSHKAPFAVQVTTDSGVDLTPPLIEATSIQNGGYVPYGVSQTAFSVYTNEPVVDCRWSNSDTEYSLMTNYFLCSGIPSSASPYFENECTTLLNVTEGKNEYYIACIDGAGNANTENTYFSLQSTVPLNIEYVSPNGETIYVDDVEMQVKTFDGAENGNAVCYYGGIEFFETGSSLHKQTLQNLIAGNYEYNINCVDAAGNANVSKINFIIEFDVNAPKLINLYRSDSTVYFTLDEDAECEYYYEKFNFGYGTTISGNSFTLTDVDEYYLKCQDMFGNIGEWVINV